MDNLNDLQQAVKTLSEAIQQFEQLIVLQKTEEKEHQIKQFAVLASRFRQLSGTMLGNAAKDKYQKGWLRKWLTNRNMLPAQAIDTLKGNQFVEQTALYLAENFYELEDFYQQLKYGQSQRRNFVFKPNKNALPYIRKWSELLKQQRFIDSFVERTDGIFIDIAELADATSFIYGHWLEVLLRVKVANYLRTSIDNITSFDVLSQVHILKPNDQHTELDLLVMINEKVYWFECKAGDIGDYYKLFKTHQGMLGLTYMQSAAVVPEPNVQLAKNFRQKSNMQCFNAIHIDEQLARFFQQ